MEFSRDIAVLIAGGNGLVHPESGGICRGRLDYHLGPRADLNLADTGSAIHRLQVRVREEQNLADRLNDGVDAAGMCESPERDVA